MHEAILIMHFLREISLVIDIADYNKTMKYAVFEDNNRVLELVKFSKIRPCTKHIAIKYYHFCTYIQNSDIKIEKVDTTEQEADFLTKPLVMQLFCYLRRKVKGDRLVKICEFY